MALFDYIEARNLLSKYGIRSIESRYVSSAKESIAFSEGERIVLKVLSDKALHKSKSGLVKLNLESPKQVTNAFEELRRKAQKLAPYKIIAQKMAKGGIEVIIGGRTDPQFGKLILIGLGGIYVEIFRDFALRVCPIKEFDADEMIKQLKARKVMTYNGRNEKTIRNLLLSISKLLLENDTIQELDLNPVILREDSYDIVDIRILK